MSRILARKVVAYMISLIFALALGAVTGPVLMILTITDPVHGMALFDRMYLIIDRVYYRLASGPPPRSRRTISR